MVIMHKNETGKCRQNAEFIEILYILLTFYRDRGRISNIKGKGAAENNSRCLFLCLSGQSFYLLVVYFRRIL